MKIAALLSLFPVLAFAEPRIETIDRGDAVEVIAHDVTAATTTLVPVRSRLEIQVANKPAPINVPSSDPTIVISELDGKTLSVKTALDRGEVKNLAAHAKAMQIGPDLHLLIPRKVPAAGATIELPEPTLANVPKVVEVELPKPEPAQPTAHAATTAQVAVPPARPIEPAPATTEPPRPAVASRPLATKTEESGPFSKAGMLGMMALVAIGCGMWLVRKKRQQQGPQSSIEVLAQHSLGAKAKVVWIAAGGREMVLAVTPQGVRMLGTWDRSDTAAAETQFATYTEHGKRTRLPTAQIADTTSMPIPIRAARPAARAQTVDSSSPAVAGLLKLRAQTTRPASLDEGLTVDDDVATDDPEADALWAKEILLATRASGNGRAARGTR